MSTLIEKAMNGISAYKTREGKSFWDSHLGFFQYIFRKNQGQMRGNNYLKELQKENSSVLNKIKVVYTLLKSTKGPTLKEDVACNLLEMTTVENETRDQIIIKAIDLIEEYLLFHILSNKSSYDAAHEEISLLEKQANTFKPEPAPAKKEAKELPAPGYWR
jgi:hypothetical protein